MDAYPRIITEAFCYNIPALVNYNIVGGNVVNPNSIKYVTLSW
jgi:hypothetical protein